MNVDELLMSRYNEGEYELAMSIYRAECRFPRILAPEDKLYGGRIILHAKSKGCYFLMSTSGQAGGNNCPDECIREDDRVMWYMDNGEWTRAEIKKEGYVIPADVFDYTTASDIDIVEAVCIAGFTKSRKHPGTTQCREINIHCC